jgi:hypothetical protein
MPLRHIEVKVIWEGNFGSDIKNFGIFSLFLDDYFKLLFGLVDGKIDRK